MATITEMKKQKSSIEQLILKKQKELINLQSEDQRLAQSIQQARSNVKQASDLKVIKFFQNVGKKLNSLDTVRVKGKVKLHRLSSVSNDGRFVTLENGERIQSIRVIELNGTSIRKSMV